jgi:hypothetical protein
MTADLSEASLLLQTRSSMNWRISVAEDAVGLEGRELRGRCLDGQLEEGTTSIAMGTASRQSMGLRSTPELQLAIAAGRERASGPPGLR